MNKKALSLILFSTLLIAGYVPIVAAHNPGQPGNPNWPFPVTYDATHAVVDTISEPETVDPAWCYDTDSGELIFNVYETLVFYDNIMTDGPYAAGKGERFKPMLATDVSILPGPGAYVKTLYFKIRGVGSAHTFVPATGVTLFDETDPDYGKAGVPKSDVSEVYVPDKPYTLTGSPLDTTWIETTTGVSYGTECVLRSWSDNDHDGKVSAGDNFDMVREGRNQPRGPWWNVREYWTVDSMIGVQITTTDPPVYFQNGAPLTPEDVEYSFERAFVQDRSGGPTWMLWYPTQGLYYALSPEEDPNFGAVIDDMIGSNATHAWISLKTDFPETTFLQILSQSWSSILNKAWCIAEGDFDGDFVGHTWQYIWDTWHNPPVSFLQEPAPVMMGTGPYKFDYWVPGTAWSIIKYDNYWDGWPALVTATGKERIGGYLERITWNLITLWSYRRARFLTGDVDFTAVPRQYRDQILGQNVGGELVRCFYPVVPQISLDAYFFNFDINPESPYLGSGFDPANPHVIAEDRIPVDLFSDINVRRGFAAAFDYDLFIVSIGLGEAGRAGDPIIPGLPYDNPAAYKPTFGLGLSEYYLKLAWGGVDNPPLGPPWGPEDATGALWNGGMNFTVPYNRGNVAREVAGYMLKNNLETHPKFHLSVVEVEWGSTYLPQMVAGMLPLFVNGWAADYPDPDDFVFPFMHSEGTFAQYQKYINPRVDALIMVGALMPPCVEVYNGELDLPDPRPYMNNYNPDLIAIDPHNCIPPDTRWPRLSIYYELQAIYAIDDVPGFCLFQAIGRHWEQAWMRGWYYNPLYGGSEVSDILSTAPEATALYFYHLWKAQCHFGDANNDGVVGLLDAAMVSACWTKPSPSSPLGPLGYKTQADLTGGTGGTPNGLSGLVVGIPDGKVSIVDAALVSSYWDGPPQGPSHP